MLGAGVATGVAQGARHDIAAAAHAVANPGGGPEAAPKLVKTEKTHILNGTILLEPGTKLEVVPGPSSPDQSSDAYVGATVTRPILVVRPLVNMQGQENATTSYQFNFPAGGKGINEITAEGTTQGVNPFYFGNGDMLALPAAELDGGTVSESIPPNPDGNPAEAVYPITTYIDSNGGVNFGNASEVARFNRPETPPVGVEALPVPDGTSTAKFVEEQNQLLGTTYQVPGN